MRNYKRPAKRYQNDLRAIKRATGAGHKEAQGLYRQVRDLAGGRPRRDRLVKSASYHHKVRSEFDRGPSKRKLPTPEPKREKLPEFEYDTTFSEGAQSCPPWGEEGNTIHVTAPFLIADYEEGTLEDGISAEADIFREGNSWLRSEGIKRPKKGVSNGAMNAMAWRVLINPSKKIVNLLWIFESVESE